MKRNLLAILIAASLAACNSKEKKDVAQELLPLNNSNLYKSSILTDTAKAVSEKTIEAPVKEVIVYRPVVREIIREKVPVVKQEESTVKTDVPVTGTGDNNNNTTTGTETTNSNTPVVTNTGSGESTNGNDQPVATETKKKGWSNAAKGAVIGGVGGAVAGAVINGKNRGKGAIIGGVIGAAGGYIFGKSKDKKQSADNFDSL